jgi:hypothetical protein
MAMARAAITLALETVRAPIFGCEAATSANLFRVDARPELSDLRAAVWRALEALCSTMSELVPEWRVPARFLDLLAPYAPRRDAGV